MIFLMNSDEPVLFVMLNEGDVKEMRGKRTLFIDQRHLQGRTFASVVLSLHRTNDEAKELVARVQRGNAENRFHCNVPTADEEKCKKCSGLGALGSMLDNTCIMCWREEALSYRNQRN